MAKYVLPSQTSKSIWGFDPRSIGGCAIWYDAADSSSVTVTGSNVTAWRDKSGNGRNASPTTGAFQYVSAFNGSYPTLSSSISGGNGQIASIPSFTLSNPSTLFAVIQNRGLNSGTNTFPYLFNVGSGGNRAYAYAYNQTTTPGSFRISTGSPGTGNIDVATAVDTTTAQVFTMQMDVPSTLSYTNGNLISTTTNSGAPVNSSTLNIGGSGGGTNERWTGHFCEFIIINNQISTTQRQQIEGYLAWKWGIQGRLPTNHPYSPNLISPSAYGGLALWLDAADASTVVSSGSNVTQWNDKSGNGRSTTGVIGTPTYATNLQNGLNGIRIGNSAGLNLPSFVLSSTSRVSAFIVANQLTNVGGGNVEMIVANPYENFTMALNSGTNEFNTFVNGLKVVTSYNTINTPAIYTLVYDGATAFRFVTGSEYSSYSRVPGSSLSASQTFNIGGNPTTNLQYFECILFSTNLATSQRQQIEAYLAWKWGLQASLPVTHPYYTIAPYYTPNPYSALGPPLSRQFSPTDIATPCRLWCDSSDSVYQGPVGTSSVFASGLGSAPRCGRFDSAGNLWVVLGNSTTTLNRITSAGVVSTVTVTGTSLPGSIPVSLAIDGVNNLYVGAANLLNTPIVKVTPAGVGSVYVTPTGQLVRGLAWDSTNSFLWWGRSDGNLVKFDGTTQTVYSGGFGSGQVLVGAVYGGFVYTHNTDINCIVRYNTSGTPVGTIVSTSGNALLKDLTDLNVDSNGIVYGANMAIAPSLIVRIGTDGSVANYSFADFQFGVALDSSNRLYTTGFSASNVLRYTDGGIGVGRWTDKSGNGNDIGIFSGTRPTYDSATKLVSVSGQTSYFQTPTLTMASGTARCTFLVYRVPTLPSESTQIFLNPMITGTTQSNAAGGYFIRFNRNTSSTYYIEQGTGQGPYVFFGPPTQTGYNGAYMVHCVQRNGNNFVTSLNGNAEFSPSHALTSNIATISGARMSGTTATLTITNGSNYAGQPIAVSGVTVASGFNYNGSWTVLASPAPTTTSVSYTIATNIPNVSGGGGTVSGFYNSNPLSDVYRIGQPPTAVGPMSFGEVIMYDGALSDVDRLRVESYLMWKWNNVRTSYPTAAGSIVPNFPPTHPFYTFPAPTVTFNPRSFGNLYMWYDGADASTIRVSTGTNVTEWRDKSGNGNNLTGTATRTPTSANAVGFDITFNGTSNSMSTTSLAVFINSTSFTYFTVVINNEPSNGYGRIVSAGTSSDNTAGDTSGFFISNDGDTPSAPFRTYNGKGALLARPFLTKAVYHIISFVFTSAPFATVFYDGVQVGTFTPASATFNFTKFSLGISITGVNQLNGVINESIAFTTALTASQRQQVEGYLAWKWGLQNLLPVTHSYIKVRP